MIIIDQLQRELLLHSTPSRIISTVPSQTELLFDLGMDNAIIGITNFCTHPAEAVKNKTKVGGTKQLNIPLIISLQPDLVIANKEENDRAQITALINQGIPVYVSDPADLESALYMIRDIGVMTGKQQQADQLVATVSLQFTNLKRLETPVNVAYLIWRKPYMVTGNDTFINDMLDRCGFANVFTKARYPEVTAQGLQEANPRLVLLSSEPYPFKEKHVAEFQAILPAASIVLVDGEMFSWYGSRLLQSAGYFGDLVMRLKASL